VRRGDAVIAAPAGLLIKTKRRTPGAHKMFHYPMRLLKIFNHGAHGAHRGEKKKTTVFFLPFSVLSVVIFLSVGQV
jgi:hypothetical protein